MSTRTASSGSGRGPPQASTPCTAPPVWPRMKLDRPLGVGAKGGHGPVRYTVVGYAPGRWVRFRFTGPRGFHGFHEYVVEESEDGGVVLNHLLAMRVRELARLTWPLFWRWLHDALIEDSLDRAEGVRRSRWGVYVRLVRRARGLS